MAKILIIEDDLAFGKMLSVVLKRAGYEVYSASDGEAGMEQFKKLKCDLVVTDIYMPEKEGIEIIREIKEESPDTKIIAISGGGKSGEFIYLKFAGELGADLTFQKPFDHDEIVQAVKKLIG